MATIEEITQQATELNQVVVDIDTKLDEVRTFIQGLQAGQPVTQAQLDELMNLITISKDRASSVLAEADALDE